MTGRQQQQQKAGLGPGRLVFGDDKHDGGRQPYRLHTRFEMDRATGLLEEHYLALCQCGRGQHYLAPAPDGQGGIVELTATDEQWAYRWATKSAAEAAIETWRKRASKAQGITEE